MQRIGGRNPQLVAGDSTGDENWPAWSSDGKQIAFAKRGDGIWVMGATGESARRLTTFGSMPSWSPDGTEIIVGGEEVSNPHDINTPGEIYRVPVKGGEATRMTFSGNGRAYQPTRSPSGARIAFLR